MTRYIIAIGGTGQLALQYYVQQYLLGVVQAPFRAYVIDTDDIKPQLVIAATLLDRLQYGARENHGAGGPVASIQFIRCKPPVSSPSARALLMGASSGGTTIRAPHPANALFTEDTLNMSLTKGLFARPALSTTISRGGIDYERIELSDSSTAVIVGSILGGTGGGLMAPVIDALAHKASSIGQTVSLRAVLFGEYFKPYPKTIDSGDGQTRLQSNQRFVLRSLAESNTQLYSYYIAGGPGTKLIDLPTASSNAGLPWPDSESEPLWRATQALEFLLNHNEKAAPATFKDGEVDDKGLRKNFEDAHQQLSSRVARAHYFVRKRVVHRALSEPWASHIWGTKFLKVLEAYSAASAHGLGQNNRDRFPDQLQAALDEALRKVYRLFPPQTGPKKRTKPEAIAGVNWPKVDSQSADPALFTGQNTAAERAAATLLFHLHHS